MGKAKNKENKQGFLGGVFDFLEVAMYALVLVAVLFAFCVRIVEVDGDSMNDTLSHGDRLVLVKAFYTPQRGDIVVIHRDNNEVPLIKRVIALEGETISINNQTNQVFIDGELLDEPYVNYPHVPGLESDVTVPEGHVFVMGDHRNNSSDSRSLGCFDVDDIIGKAVLRFYPFDQFGAV